MEIFNKILYLKAERDNEKSMPHRHTNRNSTSSERARSARHRTNSRYSSTQADSEKVDPKMVQNFCFKKI